MSRLKVLLLSLLLQCIILLFVFYKNDRQFLTDIYNRIHWNKPINMTWTQNVIALSSKNDFSKPMEIRNVEILVIVISEVARKERRNNIRKTWWKSCISTNMTACWFATDRIEDIKNETQQTEILEEEKTYQDLIFVPVKPGITFGLRFLRLLQWGKAKYNFSYILRVDDDVMLCIDHLLWDLPHLPSTKLHYGWLHCQFDENVYIDSAVSMFSVDIIERFLSQNQDEILCHPFGDQQVAIWEEILRMNKTEIIILDNFRVHHTPPASHFTPLKQMNNICNKYIALHGVYGNDMIMFWNKRGQSGLNTPTEYNQFSYIDLRAACPYKPYFNWENSVGIYRHEPKPCSENPHWDIESFMYRGRENALDNVIEIISD